MPSQSTRSIIIDALRGVAAFAVVIFHINGNQTVFNTKLSPLTVEGSPYLLAAFGYTGVYLFFVISGFCIHLKSAKAESEQKTFVQPPFFSFWRRRFRRLYPTYLAALGLFLVWEFFTQSINFNGFFWWDLISHLLFLHNFDNRTVYSMNPAFWTLAIEEQLYLLYFLLLFLRAHFGWATTLLISFGMRFVWLAVALLITKTTTLALPFTEGALANWWIWGLGALSVEAFYNVLKLPRFVYSIWTLLVSLLTVTTLHYFAKTTDNLMISRLDWLFEPCLWGFTFFCLINQAMRYEGKLLPFAKNLTLIAAAIGLFSYSLYLTHPIVLGILHEYPFVAVCAALIFAYIFYFLFEKPFIQSPQTNFKTQNNVTNVTSDELNKIFDVTN